MSYSTCKIGSAPRAWLICSALFCSQLSPLPCLYGTRSGEPLLSVSTWWDELDRQWQCLPKEKQTQYEIKTLGLALDHTRDVTRVRVLQPKTGLLSTLWRT